MGTANPPLGVHRLHGDSHRQFRRPGAGKRDAAALDHLFAAAPARLAPVYRSVFVRAAVYDQGARRASWSPRGSQREDENMKKPNASQGQPASELISKRIAELGDWRGKTLSRMRTLIKEADPHVVEEWKWAMATKPGTPVWSHDGIICTGESYKSVVKLTFAKGASLKDPARLFNSSLDGNVRRAIDIREGAQVDEAALKNLVRAAVALNLKGKSKPKPRGASSKRAR